LALGPADRERRTHAGVELVPVLDLSRNRDGSWGRPVGFLRRLTNRFIVAPIRFLGVLVALAVAASGVAGMLLCLWALALSVAP
jgi:hypothetical protein